MTLVCSTQGPRQSSPASLSAIPVVHSCCVAVPGALNWASQHTFHKLGRGMLLPLYTQGRRRCAKVGPSLNLALRWWSETLKLNLQQCWEWSKRPRNWVHIYADARGAPPRIAAVVLVDGKAFFCDQEPPGEVLACFQSREDNQIMGLELLSLALALCSFEEHIAGRRVFLWSDNTGAEHAAATGRARAFDHACVAHCIWTKA